MDVVKRRNILVYLSHVPPRSVGYWPRQRQTKSTIHPEIYLVTTPTTHSLHNPCFTEVVPPLGVVSPNTNPCNRAYTTVVAPKMTLENLATGYFSDASPLPLYKVKHQHIHTRKAFLLAHSFFTFNTFYYHKTGSCSTFALLLFGEIAQLI